MFLEFYRLREQPFGVTPDPRFLYMSETHREALASLVYGIKTGRGFMALIAKPGMGKTSILFRLMQNLEPSARTVFLFQTQCDSREFLKYLLADMGIQTDSTDLVKLHSLLNEALAENAKTGKQFVVIVDEAQNLDPSVLETIRLLSDFETSRNKLMQIILAGQPQLGEKLASPKLTQLSQRISILSRLTPFSEGETRAYIQHRLGVAGYSGEPLFSPGAAALIAKHSLGIPRSINNLCFNALSWGYAEKKGQVDESIVRQVAADLSVLFPAEDAAPADAVAAVPEKAPAKEQLRSAAPAAPPAPVIEKPRPPEPPSAPAFVMSPAPESKGFRWKMVGVAAGVALVAFVAGYGWRNLGRNAGPLGHVATRSDSAVVNPAAAPKEGPRGQTGASDRAVQVDSSSIHSSPTASNPGVQVTPAGLHPTGFKTIVVKPNDTVWGLSHQYLGNAADKDFEQITELNNLANPNHIEVGQRLILPVTPKKSSNSAATDIQNPTAGSGPRR